MMIDNLHSLQDSPEEKFEHLKANVTLPSSWSRDNSDSTKMNFCKIVHSEQSTSLQPVISCCLSVNADLTWSLYVHGKRVCKEECKALQPFPSILDVSSIDSLLLTLNSLQVCAGHPEPRFVALCESKQGAIRSHTGSITAYKDDYNVVYLNGDVYPSTVRTSKCELLVNEVKCDSCKQYRGVLRALCSRQCKTTTKVLQERTQISSHTNYRYLDDEEKNERMGHLRAEVVQNRREIKQLKEKVATLHEKKSIEVDEMLHEDLESIMTEMNEDVQKSHADSSFKTIFWQQQLEANKVKNKGQVRWHPAMIRWCLNLKLISSGAYGAMRSSGVLVLPSERTLRDYTHWIKSDSGFVDEVDKQLMDKTNVNNLPEFQKFVCLIFDEVKIKEQLVYDKHTSQIIGFVNLGDVNNQLLEMERSESGEMQQCVAKNMLVFMVRGLFMKLEFPYAQFPCSSISGDVIYPLVCDNKMHVLPFFTISLHRYGSVSRDLRIVASW